MIKLERLSNGSWVATPNANNRLTFELNSIHCGFQITVIDTKPVLHFTLIMSPYGKNLGHVKDLKKVILTVTGVFNVQILINANIGSHKIEERVGEAINRHLQSIFKNT